MKTTYPTQLAVPRQGMQGILDKFVGPGASLSENLVALVPALLFGVFIITLGLYQNVTWSKWQFVAAGFLAFDMVGGIATTATFAAKRWYHRRGQGVLNHLRFIVPHVLHIGLFAWMFVENSFTVFAFFSCFLLFGAVAVLSTSNNIKRSVAHLLVFAAIVIGYDNFNHDPLMQWFIPALFIKLFASYLPSDIQS